MRKNIISYNMAFVASQSEGVYPSQSEGSKTRDRNRLRIELGHVTAGGGGSELKLVA
jgi:hypothetical protein